MAFCSRPLTVGVVFFVLAAPMRYLQSVMISFRYGIEKLMSLIFYVMSLPLQLVIYFQVQFTVVR